MFQPFVESTLFVQSRNLKVKLCLELINSLVRESEAVEGSKGMENPLELLPGYLLEEPFHFSLQKTELQQEKLLEDYVLIRCRIS
jgi:hypothetical protein